VSTGPWAVGQKVWLYRPGRTGSPSAPGIWSRQVVASVGRKWATIDRTYGGNPIRFDLSTGQVEMGKIGHCWRGDVYADRADAMAKHASRATMNRLKSCIFRATTAHFDGVKEAYILAAAALLGLPLEPHKPQEDPDKTDGASP